MKHRRRAPRRGAPSIVGPRRCGVCRRCTALLLALRPAQRKVSRGRTMDERIESLLRFWFEPQPRSREDLEQRFDRWFKADPAVDAEITARFGATARLAARGELDAWADFAKGRLALILLLDQVPRHLHRGTAAAFAQDAKALALSTEG